MENWPDDNIPFLTHFATLEDPRLNHNKRHNLADILFVSVCAVLCGANHCVAIADFANARVEWLRQFVPLEGGAPSHDTISRVLSLIDPKGFEACFINWTKGIQSKTNGDILAVDGKTVRRSFDKAAGVGAIHLVSAWSTANGVSIGQIKVADKSNEITAIPELLKMLDIEGRIITVDSMGTQKAIANQIIEQKADYMMAVKDNHPNLAADIKAFFERYLPHRFRDANDDPIPHTYHQTVDADHGRIETRRCWATDMLDEIDGVAQWKGFTSIIMLEAERKIADTTTIERRYYITSLPADAMKALGVIRAHWGIENSLHWVLDVTFREDDARTRKGHGARIKASLNRIAINLCNTNQRKMATSRKRNLASWDPRFLQELITGQQNT